MVVGKVPRWSGVEGKALAPEHWPRSRYRACPRAPTRLCLPLSGAHLPLDSVEGPVRPRRALPGWSVSKDRCQGEHT